LLIINGGQLEIGWLPPLLKSANNHKINTSGSGFLDVSGAVILMDKPATVSRAYGDVHPDGNPHFVLDIHNILPIAELISMKLAQVDPTNATTYNRNYQSFQKKIEELIQRLEPITKSCQGKKVIQYHELFNYALDSFGVEKVGDIEPLAGISPSSKHTFKLINIINSQGIKTILQDVYHEKRTAKFIADKTGASVRIVPHDVGAVEGTDTLESFYTKIAEQICQ
jgi:zinc/manganese transport system substrate-binding protein